MHRTRAAYAVHYIKQNNSDIGKSVLLVLSSRIEAWISGVKLRKYEAEKVTYKELLTVTHRMFFIADLFTNKYEDLYKGVSFDPTEMDCLRQDIEDKVAEAGYDSNCILMFENIVNAASKLKPGKHDGYHGLSSDLVINACDKLYIHIAMFLSALVVHGYVTNFLSFSTVLPIHKGKILTILTLQTTEALLLVSISD